jgi:hypothetical protein
MLIVIGARYQLGQFVAGNVSTEFGANRASSGIYRAHRVKGFHPEHTLGGIQEEIDPLRSAFQTQLESGAGGKYSQLADVIFQ